MAHEPQRTLERIAFDPDAPQSEHLATCTECRSAIDTLRSERDTFLRARPRDLFFAELDRKIEARKWWRLQPLHGAALVAALAAVLVAFLLRPPGQEITLKGTGLQVFVSKSGEPATPHDPDEPLYEGNILRFSVSAADAGFVVIASFDDRGRYTRYYPQSGDGALTAGEHLLPGSIVLDDFLGEERVIAIFSKRPRSDAEIEAAWRGSTLELDDARVHSVRLRKERR